MTFDDVIIGFRTSLIKHMPTHGLADIPVVQLDQSKKSGRLLQAIYFKLNDPVNRGWQARSYNPTPYTAGHVEVQDYEAAIRITALSNDTVLSSYDIAATVQMIVNSLPFVEDMRRINIGVQRASAIRTPTFINENDDYETEASFDFRVTFKRSIAPQTKTVGNYKIDTITRI
jgi:hypothetical protein